MTSLPLTNAKDSRYWSFKSPGCGAHFSRQTDWQTEFEIKWNDLIAYEKDSIIVGLVQAIKEVETELPKQQPSLYHQFVSLFGYPLANPLT